MLVRHSDWQFLLQEFLLRAQYKPFSYGSHDCCLFVADAINVMTGFDPAAEFRGRYHSRFGALRQIFAHGGRSVGDVAAYVARQCGFSEDVPMRARRGDMVLMEVRTDYGDSAAGIVGLNGASAIIVTEMGLWCVHLQFASRAWHV